MNYLAPASLLLLLLALSGGTWRWWDPHLMVVMPAGRYLLPCVALMAVTCGIGALRARRLPSREALADPRVWGGGMLIIFLSDWLCRPYSFFQGPTIRGELMLGGILMFGVLRGPWRGMLRWSAIFAALLAAWSFALASHDHLLFSDDHAMFLFRLKLLKAHFPSIPFWSPTWNAGIDARDFFATGALNVFLLFAPLIYAFPIEKVYNVLIAAILWGLVPAATYYASCLWGAKKHTAALAATLAMCTGLTWFRWSLAYGTLGFVVSTALAPLVIALGYRFLASLQKSQPFPCEYLSRRHAALLIATTSLLMLWLPACAALLPLGMLALPHIPAIVRSKRHIIVLVALVALNAPWIVMTMKVSKVSRFLNAEQPAATTAALELPANSQPSEEPAPPGATAEERSPRFRHDAQPATLRAALKKALTIWQEAAHSLNPLILIFGIPAILLLPRGQLLLFAMTTVWLVGLGTLGVHLKPQLELDRMLVIGSVILSYPLAHYLAHMFERARENRWSRLIASISGSFVLVAPFSAASVILNRSFVQYHFATPAVDSLAKVIRENANSGRVVFTGCVLHQLSNGHLAPLALWSETPLVASSYAHNIWRYEQVIPKSYLARGDTGITEFLNDMNATLVIAHEPEWRRYLLERPQLFEKIAHVDSFMVFRRLGVSPSYVREGTLENFRQDDHSITFTPTTERVVLKFRFFPFLTSSQCQITPVDVAPELQLIEVSHCEKGRETTITSVSPLKRLWGSS